MGERFQALRIAAQRAFGRAEGRVPSASPGTYASVASSLCAVPGCYQSRLTALNERADGAWESHPSARRRKECGVSAKRDGPPGYVVRDRGFGKGAPPARRNKLRRSGCPLLLPGWLID